MTFPNAVIIGLRAFIGIIGAVLITQGTLWAFFPDGNLETYGISVDGVLGLNQVKTDIGAGLIATGVFALLLALRGGFWWLPALITSSAFLTIRTVSLITDGYHQTIVFGIALEALFVAAVLLLHFAEPPMESDHP